MLNSFFIRVNIIAAITLTCCAIVFKGFLNLIKLICVVVVTGSSGAGTTFVKRAFEHIFNKEGITPLIVEGDSYHKYDRVAMKKLSTNMYLIEKISLKKTNSLPGYPCYVFEPWRRREYAYILL
jgi:hypothetical protein